MDLHWFTASKKQFLKILGILPYVLWLTLVNGHRFLWERLGNRFTVHNCANVIRSFIKLKALHSQDPVNGLTLENVVETMTVNDLGLLLSNKWLPIYFSPRYIRINQVFPKMPVGKTSLNTALVLPLPTVTTSTLSLEIKCCHSTAPASGSPHPHYN